MLKVKFLIPIHVNAYFILFISYYTHTIKYVIQTVSAGLLCVDIQIFYLHFLILILIHIIKVSRKLFDPQLCQVEESEN